MPEAGIALDNPVGDVYVADPDNKRILKTDEFGNFKLIWYGAINVDDGLLEPTGIAIDRPCIQDGANGCNIVYVTDPGRSRVTVFRSDVGLQLYTFGELGTDPGEFIAPWGIAIYRPLN